MRAHRDLVKEELLVAELQTADDARKAASHERTLAAEETSLAAEGR